ncbi:MAG TPA: helix-turn-helix domain-containing protein [Amycolatopsis sp.]|uniref:helix-turn-helix domain-containing protein n=1 Tax=Amycolatopsis sp. TaxID=37632 RepID=UPI002B4A2520|nr:helix-turn-helix domain-containing protein [Amycolatopsis sp.]HKS45605.1 helix-turn-helix domain-containing protein [Amycolatopsis sp.]
MRYFADIGSRARIIGSTRKLLGADLRKRYEKGTSVRALANSIGRSYGFTNRLLKEAGTTMRKRGGVRIRRRS